MSDQQRETIQVNTPETHIISINKETEKSTRTAINRKYQKDTNIHVSSMHHAVSIASFSRVDCSFILLTPVNFSTISPSFRKIKDGIACTSHSRATDCKRHADIYQKTTSQVYFRWRYARNSRHLLNINLNNKVKHRSNVDSFYLQFIHVDFQECDVGQLPVQANSSTISGATSLHGPHSTPCKSTTIYQNMYLDQ